MSDDQQVLLPPPPPSSDHQPVQLHLVAQSALVWNCNDVAYLRKEHRILGSLMGTMDGLSHQNQLFVLPLRLLPEETRLLLDRKLAYIHSSPLPANDLELKEREKSFEEYRQEVWIEYQQAYRQKMEMILRQNLDRIVSSLQRRKQTPDDIQLDPEHVLQEKLRNIKKLDESDLPLPSFRLCPWTSWNQNTSSKFTQHSSSSSSTTFLYPTNERQTFSYRVYQHLYDMGFYLTSGLKFGCDYLAYKQDPVLYHSAYIVICALNETELYQRRLLAHNRLGSQVKKRVLIALHNQENNEIEFGSFEWKGKINSL